MASCSQTNNTTEMDLENYFIFTHNFSDMISRQSTDDGVFTYVSPSSGNLINIMPDDLIGNSLYDFIHPDDLHIVQGQFRNPYISAGKVMYRLRRKEGDYIWVETAFKKKADHVSPSFQLDEGECFSVTRNVAHFKMAVEDMKMSEEKYRTLVEHFHDTIGILTSSGKMIYLNESGKRLFGITRTEELIGKSLLSFINNDDDKDSISQMIIQVLEDNQPQIIHDIQLKRTDHDVKEVDISLIPTSYKEKHSLQVVITDITARKKTEEILQQAEKLSVVGQLAAGIAHEIRNPLTAIKGFTQLTKEQINPEYSSVILQELDRIETIVSDLLVLAKPQIVKTEVINTVELVKRTITLLNSQAILQNIMIKFHHDMDHLELECEPDQLKQVLINVIRNAMEAMPNGGVIHIYLNELKNEKVEFQIVDEGVGIPRERLKKMGEPFYSTKEKGTGLGLMICQKIIKNHHGQLNIDSEVGKGTTISIILPLTNSN
ncbi:MAG: ATP-binding protein [Tuberibacillus sp.]